MRMILTVRPVPTAAPLSVGSPDLPVVTAVPGSTVNLHSGPQNFNLYIEGVRFFQNNTATARLNALCRADDLPWTLSFSFGRALQNAAMKLWKGVPANTGAAQATLRHRARCDSLALTGRYSEEVESAAPPGR